MPDRLLAKFRVEILFIRLAWELTAIVLSISCESFLAVLYLSVGELSYSQLKKSRHEVGTHIANNQVGQAIAEHEENITNCPHCTSHKLNRWGMTKQGIQRFKCKSCSKTFNALADSPLYRMKKSEKRG